MVKRTFKPIQSLNLPSEYKVGRKAGLSPEEKAVYILAGLPEPRLCNNQNRTNEGGPCHHMARLLKPGQTGGGLCVCCMGKGNVYFTPGDYFYNCDGSLNDVE